MRVLADENISGSIIDWLISQGHDVLSVAKMFAALKDKEILEIAVAERRVILTGDKDFGDLVFKDRLAHTGVVLLRLSGMDSAEQMARVASIWPAIESVLPSSFVVISRHKTRIHTM